MTGVYMLLQKKLAVQPFQAFTGWKACVTAAHRPRSTVHSAICRPRPAFVDSFPIRWRSSPPQASKARPAYSAPCRPSSGSLESPPYAVCGPRSAVYFAVW